ncbi:uncharacterized protein PG986_012479 [Apiospora aurea]|uniref:Uncharacterized protein n=1 Tax=Apiospora aurea TaxID=335848 RepID=A0ABR1Q037_9PEZI
MRQPTYTLPRGDGPRDRLLAAEGYTVLCACAPHEEANEIKIESPGKEVVLRGALSYFLLGSLLALRRRGAQISHQSLHQHLRASFHARHPHQTPMLYGKSGLSFFDCLISSQDMTLVSAYKDMNGCLVLDAGQAHGVHVDDEYALYASLAPGPVLRRSEQAYLKTRAISVDYLTSERLVMSPSNMPQAGKGSTWKAELLTSYSTRKVQVRLTHSADTSTLSPGIVGPYLSIVPGNDSTLDQDLERATPQELMYHCPISLLFPVKGDESQLLLLKTLAHVAAYKFFEGIDNTNPNREFEKSFSLECDCVPGPDGYRQVQHGQPLNLTFNNLDTVPKYVALLNFSYTWGVSNLVASEGEGDYLAIDPRGADETGGQELPLEMNVPPHMLDRGLKQTEDTVKVFVTNKPTHFPSMILPRLDADDLRGDDGHSTTPWQDLIWGLPGTRETETGSWATQTFLVRTTTK